MHFTFATDDGMGWLEFIAAMFGTLAWPLVVVVLALIYRGPISHVLKNLKEAKWGENSLTLGTMLDQAEEKQRELAANLPEPEQQGEFELPPVQLPETDDEAELFAREEAIFYEMTMQEREVIELEPKLIVLNEWGSIERKLFELDARFTHLGDSHGHVNAPRIARELASRNLLSKEAVELIREMRTIRNNTAHVTGFTVSRLDALRFLKLSKQVQKLLALVGQ